jgi:hypothetical protein
LGLRLAVLLLAAGLASGCAATEEGKPTAPGVRDAGDNAFVRRVLPLMWGRRATSNREVAMLAGVATTQGRDALLRGMARDEAYLDHWGEVLMDAMAVPRLGFSANGPCYARTLAPETGPELAEYVRDNAPTNAPWPTLFTVRDLIRSALVLDDLTPIYRASLVAGLARSIDDMHQLAAMSQRQNRAESFVVHYLDRRMSCLGCHNSETAVTWSPDPEVNRHWPMRGAFEKALFGQSTGRPVEELSRFFRRKGVQAGYFYTHDAKSDEAIAADAALGIAPWGWDAQCGTFLPPEQIRPDDVLELDGYFGIDRGETGSIWDLEASLAAGFATLRETGLRVEGDDSVQADPAFAYLVSASIAHRVWQQAFGRPLTVANYFPRNAHQRDTLQGLTEVFVGGGFSLLDALIATTKHPYFNDAVPASGEDPRPYAPVFDPFADEDRVTADRRNDIGDTVRRAPARVLLRSAHQALGWPEPPEFLLYYLSPSARMQRDVGVFLKNGDPGFEGTSFQSALAWETWFGQCTSPTNSPICPLEPILADPLSKTSTVCELCSNRDLACDWDARCCDMSWDVCSDDCSTGDPETVDLAVFPSADQPTETDAVSQIVASAQAGSFTVEDAVKSLLDRLLADSRLDDPAQRASVEALLAVPLSQPAAGDAELEERLRRVCGAVLTTPQFTLLGPTAEDVPADLAVALPVETDQALCARLGALFGDGLACP